MRCTIFGLFKKKNGRERRKSVRLSYPRTDRPKLVIMGREYPIIDVSVSGVKFKCSLKVSKGNAFDGQLLFGDRAHLKCQGVVVRVVGDLVMAQFKSPIPMKVLKKEADYLLARYGSIAS